MQDAIKDPAETYTEEVMDIANALSIICLCFSLANSTFFHLFIHLIHASVAALNTCRDTRMSSLLSIDLSLVSFCTVLSV